MTTRNSTLVANYEATPQVANNSQELHGVVRVAQGTIDLLAGDSTANDVVMLAPLPSNASITALKIGSDALGGSCTFNVGLHNTDGSAADADVYATAVADEGAMADVRTEAANITTIGQKLWQDAGATSDPGGYYYVSVTFAVTGGTAGDMSFIIEYVVN